MRGCFRIPLITLSLVHLNCKNGLVNGAMVSSKMYLLVIEVNGRVVTKEKIIHKF